MPTFARTASSVPVDSQPLAVLHLALGAFSKDFTAQLVALVHAQLGAAKPLRKAVENAVAQRVPLLLEQAFVTSFLTSKEHSREQRAFLTHLLSTAELQATFCKDHTASIQAKGVPKAGAGAGFEDDEELTSEAAANLLHVSRTHLNTLADSGALGVIRRTGGGHRRISKAGLLKYKALSQQRQARGLDAMVAASQSLGLYEAEVAGLPVNAGR